MLRDKCKRAPEELARDRADIEACTVRVVSTERLHVAADDEDDNRVLEVRGRRRVRVRRHRRRRPAAHGQL